MKRIILAYFSPTHTTEKVVKAIAQGMGIEEIVDYNMTLSQDKPIKIEEGDILILGGPVYVGRIPTMARKRMQQITGDGQAAICVAVYGNNKVGDALAELADLATKAKLIPVAGTSFIGEHSYANEQYHIANGRPDQHDLSLAKAFGRQVVDLIRHQLDKSSPLKAANFPGEIPSEAAPALPPLESIATRDCNHCNRCIAVCPVGAIDSLLKCDSAKCIHCYACVKACESDAREIISARIEEFSLFLSQLEDKVPEFYGV